MDFSNYINTIMILFNIYNLLPFKNMNTTKNTIILLTFLEVISIICIFLMLNNLYNMSKKQFKQSIKVHVLKFQQINSIDKKNIYIFYEDYWI